MTLHARNIVGLFLALALMATSAMVGAARGQTMAAGQIVICSGQGVVSIAVDAEGNPVGSVHVCPDCVLTLLAAPEAAPVDLAHDVDWRIAPWAGFEKISVAAVSSVPPVARGPPGFVSV